MNINVNVNLSATPELLAVLSALVGGSPTDTKKNGTKADKVPPVPVSSPAETPVLVLNNTPTTVAAEAEVDELDSSVTIEMVREAVQAKSLAGKKEAVKNLLTAFGVQRVTALKPEQYAEFLQKVNAL